MRKAARRAWRFLTKRPMCWRRGHVMISFQWQELDPADHAPIGPRMEIPNLLYCRRCLWGPPFPAQLDGAQPVGFRPSARREDAP
jgi:hypothetical protein